MKNRLCAILAALAAAACLLSACGPEPAAGETGGSLFGQEESKDPPAAGAGQEAGAESAVVSSGEEAAQGQETAAGSSTAAEQTIAEDPSAADTSAVSGTAAEADPSGTEGRAGEAEAGKAADREAQTASSGEQNTYEKTVPLDSRALKALEEYLNEGSSYGFLLSCYEKPEDIDLEEVFYAGAGAPRGKLEEKEKKLLLERLGMDELHTSVTKVKEEYVEELLARKAGITYDQSNHPLDKWVRIRRYGAYYHIHGDTNQVGIRCTDGWQQGNTYILHYQRQSFPPDTTPETTEDGTKGTAYYEPTYEVELEKEGDDYRFRSNILWVQKDLIEAQSYKAGLNPMGDVFFAPMYPDTAADPRADVTFILVRDKALLMTLAEMEDGNIRSDRIFTGVDAVDFTDYNGDGYTDILTVCSYQKVDEKGNRTGEVREARVYTMQVYEQNGDSLPLLDRKKTEAVNRDVETLNITNVTEYLTGKSDGKNKKFSSWKQAYADHIRGVDEKEYAGFALISLNDDRTPELVQVGATTAKGATVVVFRSGMLEETWLNRNTFRYLEYENLLYSASGVDNLHYDSIYSIVRGRLGISVQGYYGNSSFARVRYDENGRESYDYFWDGGQVSENGYRDGLEFVFDISRAKECGAQGLLTAEEMLEKLK